MLKELLLTFLVCLVIGAIINGWSIPPPPPPDTSEPGVVESQPGGGEEGSQGESGSEGSSGSGTSGTSNKVMETGDDSFQQDVISSKVPVLVDFNATWCGPCKMMAPIVDKLAREYSGKVRIYKLDIDQNPQIASKYDVSSIPTFIMFRDGKQVAKYTGAIPKEMLAGVIDKQLGLQ